MDLLLDFALYSLPVLAFFLAAWLLEGAWMVWRILTGEKND